MTFLAGHPQEWLLLVLALSAWSLADALAVWLECMARARLRLGSSSGAARLALSLGLAALDLAPQLAVRPWLLRRPRRSRAASVPRRYHLEALNGFQLLSPTALGGPADYFGNDNYWETLLSIGLVPLLLAVLGGLPASGPQARSRRGWCSRAWHSGSLAGATLLLYTAAYFIVPGMSWFRVPARSLFLANLGAAVLAGLGVQTIATRMAEPRCVATFAARLRACPRPDRCWRSISLGLARRPACSFADVSRPLAGCSRTIAFALTLGGLAALLVLGCLPSLDSCSATGRRLDRPARPLRAGLARELALAGGARRSSSWARPGERRARSARSRIRVVSDVCESRRAITSTAICRRLRTVFEKTNVNDVFQIDHAARLYEQLYPVAAHRRREPR